MWALVTLPTKSDRLSFLLVDFAHLGGESVMVSGSTTKVPMGKITGILEDGTELVVYVDKAGHNIILQTISKSHIIRPLSGKNSPDSWVIEAQEVFGISNAVYASMLN